MDKQKLHDVIDLAWLNLGDTSKITVASPFDVLSEKDVEKIELLMMQMMADPEYIYWAAKIIFNVELLPTQCVILRQIWEHPFPMLIASRGFGKSFMLALYSMLLALFRPGIRICIVGAAFRQSKIIFEYVENIWQNAPILREIIGDDGYNGSHRDADRYVFHLGKSRIIAIPLGDGSKIRGQRASVIIADEFASIPIEIYENVVVGFAAVSASPIKNVKKVARMKMMEEMGMLEELKQEKETVSFNQAIISGTAYYEFNHFYDYWKKYKQIVLSKGNPEKIKEIFDGAPPTNFNWKDYCVIRIPYELLPKGFMDEKQVSRAKATVHSGIYQMEYGACFSSDSNGFFKRSLLNSCTAPIELPMGKIEFTGQIKGRPGYKYVYGVDPASERDNFSIVILEINENHRRVVYCWTTTRSAHKELLKTGVVKETDFYGFCARKIRDLMRVFPTDNIGLDSQGGGVAVEEALHDEDKLEPGETPIWRKIVPGNYREEDDQQGQHILELIQFAKADWVSDANNGLRKDMEDKMIIFPQFDALTLELAIRDDERKGRVYNTLEQCILEIEELKNELTTIVLTQSTMGRDRWDTPETKIPGGKKGRLRKDRYSALLIANMLARQEYRKREPVVYNVNGGFARDLATNKSKNTGNRLYFAPDSLSELNNLAKLYGIVRR